MLDSLARVNTSLDALFRRCLTFARDLRLADTVYRPPAGGLHPPGPEIPGQPRNRLSLRGFPRPPRPGDSPPGRSSAAEAPKRPTRCWRTARPPWSSARRTASTAWAPSSIRDFFHGLAHHCLPHRCKNCGRYFLLAGGSIRITAKAPWPGMDQRPAGISAPGKVRREVPHRSRLAGSTTGPTRPTMPGI